MQTLATVCMANRLDSDKSASNIHCCVQVFVLGGEIRTGQAGVEYG